VARHVEGPWFRTSKNAWYATINSQMLSLGVRGLEGKEKAWKAWHRLMADGASTQKPDPRPAEPSTVAQAVTLFLIDAAARVKPSTLGLYRRHLTTLAGDLGKERIADLTPLVLCHWLHGLGVLETTKAITLRSVSAFLGWAVQQGLCERNVAQRLSKPRGRSRSVEAVISPEDHHRLLEKATTCQQLVLHLLYLTGARPGELCRITAENFDPEAAVVRLAEHKTDRRGRDRLIFLPPSAVELLKQQAAKYPSGPLLRNRLGRPWTPKGISWAMIQIRRKAGGRAIAYGYRHSFCTEALARGVGEGEVGRGF
jgi:integrase/recombinase XerC